MLTIGQATLHCGYLYTTVLASATAGSMPLRNSSNLSSTSAIVAPGGEAGGGSKQAGRGRSTPKQTQAREEERVCCSSLSLSSSL